MFGLEEITREMMPADYLVFFFQFQPLKLIKFNYYREHILYNKRDSLWIGRTNLCFTLQKITKS
jgi:hypothetical protein